MVFTFDAGRFRGATNKKSSRKQFAKFHFRNERIKQFSMVTTCKNEFWSARGGYGVKIEGPPMRLSCGPLLCFGKAGQRPRQLPLAHFHALVQLDIPQLQQQPALLVHHPKLTKLHCSEDSAAPEAVGRLGALAFTVPEPHVGQRGLELDELDGLGRGFQAGLESLLQLGLKLLSELGMTYTISRLRSTGVVFIKSSRTRDTCGLLRHTLPEPSCG